MVLVKIYILFLFVTILHTTSCHHVHHRIHVPTKVKTIFHTKIIKVPEHHHYIHEKEKPKLIKVPEHHHYFHEDEKDKHVDSYDFHHKEDDEFEGDFENDYKPNYSHNIFKKHAPSRRRHRKRKH